jgi:hypothetical protein
LHERHETEDSKPETNGVASVFTGENVVRLIIGLFAAALTYVFTVSDLKVKDADQDKQIYVAQQIGASITQRLDTMSARISTNAEALAKLDDEGTRSSAIAMSALRAEIEVVKQLHLDDMRKIDALEDAVDSVNGAIAQHNEAEFDMWKRQHPGRAIVPHHFPPPPIKTPSK